MKPANVSELAFLAYEYTNTYVVLCEYFMNEKNKEKRKLIA